MDGSVEKQWQGLGQSIPALTALIKSGCNINGPWISLICLHPNSPTAMDGDDQGD